MARTPSRGKLAYSVKGLETAAAGASPFTPKGWEITGGLLKGLPMLARTAGAAQPPQWRTFVEFADWVIAPRSVERLAEMVAAYDHFADEAPDQETHDYCHDVAGRARAEVAERTRAPAS